MTGRGDYSSGDLLELPVAVYSLTCRLSRPTPLRGLTLQRKLRGAFHRGLVDLAPTLFRPEPGARRHHGAPVVIRFPWAGPGPGALLLEGEIVLWGRQAGGISEPVLRSVREAGRAGLAAGPEPVGTIPFDVEVGPDFAGTLDAWAERTFSGAGRRLTVRLASPCDAERPSLPEIAGNAADALVRWDLADRGMSLLLEARAIDDCAAAARAAAERAFVGVAIRDCTSPRRLVGEIPPSRARSRFALHGFDGCWELDGDLLPARPWLALLALHGAGQHRSFGLGQIRLEVPLVEDRPYRVGPSPKSAAPARAPSRSRPDPRQDGPPGAGTGRDVSRPPEVADSPACRSPDE